MVFSHSYPLHTMIFSHSYHYAPWYSAIHTHYTHHDIQSFITTTHKPWYSAIHNHYTHTPWYSAIHTHYTHHDIQPFITTTHTPWYSAIHTHSIRHDNPSFVTIQYTVIIIHSYSFKLCVLYQWIMNTEKLSSCLSYNVMFVVNMAR